MNYKNYFQYAYQKETYPKYNRSKSKLIKKPKMFILNLQGCKKKKDKYL